MIRFWLFRPILCALERHIMSALSDLANKISADIDAKMAAVREKEAADAATIANLQGQLAALQASDADTQVALVTLQAADAKLV